MLSHLPTKVDENLLAVRGFIVTKGIMQALQDYSMLLLAVCLMKIVVRVFPTAATAQEQCDVTGM